MTAYHGSFNFNGAPGCFSIGLKSLVAWKRLSGFNFLGDRKVTFLQPRDCGGLDQYHYVTAFDRTGNIVDRDTHFDYPRTVCEDSFVFNVSSY